MNGHSAVMVDYLDHEGIRWFEAHCECGWKTKPEVSNRCMGNHRRHVAAVRRRAAR